MTRVTSSAFFSRSFDVSGEIQSGVGFSPWASVISPGTRAKAHATRTSAGHVIVLFVRRKGRRVTILNAFSRLPTRLSASLQISIATDAIQPFWEWTEAR